MQLHHLLSLSHPSRALLLWSTQPTNLIFHVNWLLMEVGEEIMLSVWVMLRWYTFSCLLHLCTVFKFNSFTYIPAPAIQKLSCTSSFKQRFQALED